MLVISYRYLVVFSWAACSAAIYQAALGAIEPPFKFLQQLKLCWAGCIMTNFLLIESTASLMEPIMETFAGYGTHPSEFYQSPILIVHKVHVDFKRKINYLSAVSLGLKFIHRAWHIV